MLRQAANHFLDPLGVAERLIIFKIIYHFEDDTFGCFSWSSQPLEASEVRWFFEDSKIKNKWLPFMGGDSLALENQHRYTHEEFAEFIDLCHIITLAKQSVIVRTFFFSMLSRKYCCDLKQLYLLHRIGNTK